MSDGVWQRPDTLGSCATLACLWEATAPKPGNVYRGADFGDMTFADFLLSGTVIGPVMDQAAVRSVGELVLAAVEATQAAVAANTNLGTVLLLAPLAKAASEGGRQQLLGVLQATTLQDSQRVYQAVRLAAPGGLGEVAQEDVSQQPTVALQEAMRLAADRDVIARQYVAEFEDVLRAADYLEAQLAEGLSLADSIVWTYLEQMSQLPDTLIARKCGEAVALESATRAARLIEMVRQEGEDFRVAAAELDFWLRADGNRRNPGATADLVAAALFVLLIEDRLSWPVRFYG